MTKSQLLAVLLLSASLSACGGNKTVDCDDGFRFQNRETGTRVVAPEGLDQLNEYAEMPIPEADPNAAPPLPGKCADMPPTLTTGS